MNNPDSKVVLGNLKNFITQSQPHAMRKIPEKRLDKEAEEDVEIFNKILLS